MYLAVRKAQCRRNQVFPILRRAVQNLRKGQFLGIGAQLGILRRIEQGQTGNALEHDLCAEASGLRQAQRDAGGKQFPDGVPAAGQNQLVGQYKFPAADKAQQRHILPVAEHLDGIFLLLRNVAAGLNHRRAVGRRPPFEVHAGEQLARVEQPCLHGAYAAFQAHLYAVLPQCRRLLEGNTVVQRTQSLSSLRHVQQRQSDRAGRRQPAVRHRPVSKAQAALDADNAGNIGAVIGYNGLRRLLLCQEQRRAGAVALQALLLQFQIHGTSSPLA